MNSITEGYRIMAKNLRERAAGVSDNERRAELYIRAADYEQMACDVEKQELQEAKEEKE